MDNQEDMIDAVNRIIIKRRNSPTFMTTYEELEGIKEILAYDEFCDFEQHWMINNFIERKESLK